MGRKRAQEQKPVEVPENGAWVLLPTRRLIGWSLRQREGTLTIDVFWRVFERTEVRKSAGVLESRTRVETEPYYPSRDEDAPLARTIFQIAATAMGTLDALAETAPEREKKEK